MQIQRSNSLEARIRRRILISRDAVFVRADFADFEQEYDYDQVGRVLRRLVREGMLMKAGYGLYVRTRTSRFTDKPVPDIGMREMAEQALRKLGVEMEPSLAEQRYNAGLSTQVPTGRVIRVKGRIKRRLNFNGFPLSYEYARQTDAL